MSTPPTHNPNTEPIGENPFIFLDDSEVVWSWDFTKNRWFVFDENDLQMPGQKRTLPEESGSENPVSEQKAAKKKKVVDTRPATVYVENLPTDTTPEEIYSFFSKAGIIKRDEFTGEYAIKIYENEDGTKKGDAIVTYFKPESLPLALQILDGADFRFNLPIKVTEVCTCSPNSPLQKSSHTTQAQFDPSKKRKKKEKKKKLPKKHRVRFDQSKELSWEEESRVHVVLKGLFEPKDTWTDLNFAEDLKEDVKEECEKFGPVETVAVFENNPEGVVTVKFLDPPAAERCIEVMNGRYFAGKQIHADFYDGFTNYKREETEEQKKLRSEAWAKFVQDEEDDEE